MPPARADVGIRARRASLERFMGDSFHRPALERAAAGPVDFGHGDTIGAFPSIGSIRQLRASPCRRRRVSVTECRFALNVPMGGGPAAIWPAPSHSPRLAQLVALVDY